jgi:hypothetical protein
MAYKQNDYVIENNIIANTVEGDKNIEVDYAPSHLISRGNVYAPGARFRWNETKHWVTMSFSEWKAATGQDEDSKTGAPKFVDAAAGDLHGRLLLIHGSQDENVHLGNTLQLAYELQKANKQFDLMIYPKNRHGISRPDQSRHLRELMTQFIIDRL